MLNYLVGRNFISEVETYDPVPHIELIILLMHGDASLFEKNSIKLSYCDTGKAKAEFLLNYLPVLANETILNPNISLEDCVCWALNKIKRSSGSSANMSKEELVSILTPIVKEDVTIPDSYVTLAGICLRSFDEKGIESRVIFENNDIKSNWLNISGICPSWFENQI